MDRFTSSLIKSELSNLYLTFILYHCFEFLYKVMNNLSMTLFSGQFSVLPGRHLSQVSYFLINSIWNTVLSCRTTGSPGICPTLCTVLFRLFCWFCSSSWLVNIWSLRPWNILFLLIPTWLVTRDCLYLISHASQHFICSWVSPLNSRLKYTNAYTITWISNRLWCACKCLITSFWVGVGVGGEGKRSPDFKLQMWYQLAWVIPWEFNN